MKEITGVALGDPLAAARQTAEKYRLPLLAEADWPVELRLPHGISIDFLRQNLVLPFEEEKSGTWRVAVEEPNSETLSALKVVLGDFAISIASRPALLSKFEILQSRASMHKNLPRLEDEVDHAQNAPIVAKLHRILTRALEERATDLHFEPSPNGMLVRHRIDGMLRRATSLTAQEGRAIIARLKMMAGLNISERRIAQDGPVRICIDEREQDFRLATLPIIDGEEAVLRILSGRRSLPTIHDLGLTETTTKQVEAALSHAYGLIVITGPTGSGKTTTLAAATGYLNVPTRKIVSIEDPIEYRVSGVSQVQVNPTIGLTFVAGLRAFMRADPDVLLVGEVRDAETAKVTVQASLTGHLVLTTLHTNTAAGAIVRLAEMGVEPYLLAATLRLAVGQRLVRILCRHCRIVDIRPLPFPTEALRSFGISSEKDLRHFSAKGCDHCGGTGFYGRQAIFEVLPITSGIQHQILSGKSTRALHEKAISEGMAPLIQDGIRLVIGGTTSAEEVMRVISDE